MTSRRRWALRPSWCLTVPLNLAARTPFTHSRLIRTRGLTDVVCREGCSLQEVTNDDESHRISEHGTFKFQSQFLSCRRRSSSLEIDFAVRECVRGVCLHRVRCSCIACRVPKGTENLKLEERNGTTKKGVTRGVGKRNAWFVHDTTHMKSSLFVPVSAHGAQPPYSHCSRSYCCSDTLPHRHVLLSCRDLCQCAATY
jgi:hypothetical protein